MTTKSCISCAYYQKLYTKAGKCYAIWHLDPRKEPLVLRGNPNDNNNCKNYQHESHSDWKVGE